MTSDWTYIPSGRRSDRGIKLNKLTGLWGFHGTTMHIKSSSHRELAPANPQSSAQSDLEEQNQSNQDAGLNRSPREPLKEGLQLCAEPLHFHFLPF
jgi:hypothetical protein